MPKAVVLLSGGLDSATTLYLAKSEGLECLALTILYGQRHSIEVEAAKQIATLAEVRDHRFARVDLDLFGGSALTDALEVPKDRTDDAIPITYVPARNTVFLAMALALAESVGAQHIFIGANAVDYSGYPDCRPNFIKSFEQTANLGTKAAIDGKEFKILAPLIDMTKAQIIELAMNLGLDLSVTRSCYDPDFSGRACGRCDSCRIREQAFKELGLSDPALTHFSDV